METATSFVAPFIAYVIALGIAAAIPGPGVAAVVGRAMGKGSGSSLPFILGLALGDVLFLSVAVLGLAALAAAWAEIFFIIKIAGGLYLIYLAWQFWASDVNESKVAPRILQSWWVTMASGLAVTLGNPKTVVFYLALVPNVIDLGSVDLLDWLILSGLTTATLLAVLLPYAMMAARMRNLLTNASALRRFNRAAALMIGSAGGFILRDAMTK